MGQPQWGRYEADSSCSQLDTERAVRCTIHDENAGVSMGDVDCVVKWPLDVDSAAREYLGVYDAMGLLIDI